MLKPWDVGNGPIPLAWIQQRRCPVDVGFVWMTQRACVFSKFSIYKPLGMTEIFQFMVLFLQNQNHLFGSLWVMVWYFLGVWFGTPPNPGDGYIGCFMLIHPLLGRWKLHQLSVILRSSLSTYIYMTTFSIQVVRKEESSPASLLTVLAGLWSVRSAKLCALTCVEQKRVGNSTSSGHFGRHFGVFWWSSATLLESPRVGILRACEDYNMAWWINLPSNGEDYRTLLANARLRTQLETQFEDLHGWRLKTLQ